MTPFVAEIIGTFLLMLLGCGVVANVANEDEVISASLLKSPSFGVQLKPQ